MGFFLIIIYIIETLSLMKLEKRLWGSYLTPLNCLSIPTATVTLLSIIYPYFSDFPHFYLPSLIVWIIGLGVFSLPSFIFSSALKSKTYKLQSQIGNRRVYSVIIILSLVIIVISMLKMKSISQTSTWGGDDFSEGFTASSFIGHLSVLSAALLAYMIFRIDRNHKSSLPVTICFIIIMYAVGVKSWIIAPILIGFFARLKTRRTKFTLTLGLMIVTALVFVFVSSYIIIMVISGKSELNLDFFRFLFDHFMFYLIGSPLSFSIDFHYGILEAEFKEGLFAPLINIIRLFTRDPYLNPINTTLIYIGDGASNVRTFIGTIFAYSHSWSGMIIIILIFSLATNFINLISYHSRNPFLILANCANLTFLTLGFFEFYWLNLRPYEISLILFVLSCIYKYVPSKNEQKAIS